jgi:hypothetical protein
MGLSWSLVMSPSWLEGSQEGQNAVAAPLVHISCFHYCKVSADPPEMKNSLNFV